MSRRIEREVLDGVRTEGGLLPADVLQRIASSDKSIPGLGLADYHLDPPATLAEAITRSWNRLLGAWKVFKEGLSKLPPGDPALTLTREKWLLPLFQELGYGRLTRPQPQLLQAQGRDYPLSHLYHRSPIHLVGARVDLGKRTAGVAGAATAPPHGLVQEFLNQSDEHLWGFVSNGRLLRLLRDHRSLTRQAFVEFDLETIFDGEQFHAFRLLWLVCHQSRVDAEKLEACWLERWFALARDQGVSALKKLRGGVEESIAVLGSGFLASPANAELNERLGSDALGKADYYRQLLRLVYRLIFLFVAEDRGVLLDLSAPPEARRRFERYYSTRRLRELARSPAGSGSHGDLWQQLCVLMRQLDEGQAALGLPALGSFLWSADCIPDLDGAHLGNQHLLRAIQALTTFSENGQRLGVNWRNVGADELGSIYESLLELSPDLDRDAGTFALSIKGGHERKTTGSYYTPTPVVDCLLDASLDRLLDEAARKPLREAEASILALKVCDPACGSGHFLVAAARRIARRLAALRGGGMEPSPEENLHALREVVSHCIYGVDMNPMAVELCKVSLWMEALEPGRPLSFLDSHVQCGNAVIGALPGLVEGGIPDVAFEPIEGDQGPCASRLKKLNKKQRNSGQLSMLAPMAADASAVSEAAKSLSIVETTDDDTRAGLKRKSSAWQQYLASPSLAQKRLLADTWCAAFFWPKQAGALEDSAPTQGLFAILQHDSKAIPQRTRVTVEELERRYQFFHWHLMFPQVFQQGGFDVMLGNPPWDTMSPDAKEFFSAYDGVIRSQDKKQQEATIKRLLALPDVDSKWKRYRRDIFGQVHFLKESGRFTLFAPGNLGKGDFNIYRMFCEASLRLCRTGGYAAQALPEGFYSGPNCMALRREVFTAFSLEMLLGFENAKEIWFQGIDTRMKFCAYAAKKTKLGTTSFPASFLIRNVAHLNAGRLSPLNIPVATVRAFSPDALSIMEFTDDKDVVIAQSMYARAPHFGNESAGLPVRHYMAEIHMGNDRDLFSAQSIGLPLYEGRMVDQWDHRAKGYLSGRGRTAEWVEYPFSSAEKRINPQWHIPEANVPEKTRDRVAQFRSVFCDVASPTNERSLIAALIPPNTLAGDKVPTIMFGDGFDWYHLVWLSIANSFTMDFIARMKIALKMSYTVLDSLPFPRPAIADPVVPQLAPRALALICTSPEMTTYWNAMAHHGWVAPVPAEAVPGSLDAMQRLELRAEIEVIVARDIFGLSLDDLEHVLTRFPTTAKYEAQSYGRFVTRDLIRTSWTRV